MRISRFEEIEGWKLGRELTKAIYVLTRKPGFARDYGLRDQIQRAGGAIMHNIAEGFDSGSNAEFVRFLRYAKRSCTEVQSEIYMALDQEYVTKKEFEELYETARLTRAKLGAFIRYLQNAETPKPKPVRRDQSKPGTLNREPRT